MALGLRSLAQLLSLCAASCVPAEISYSLSPLLILPLPPSRPPSPSLQHPALGPHPKKAAALSSGILWMHFPVSFAVWADGDQG